MEHPVAPKVNGRMIGRIIEQHIARFRGCRGYFGVKQPQARFEFVKGNMPRFLAVDTVCGGESRVEAVRPAEIEFAVEAFLHGRRQEGIDHEQLQFRKHGNQIFFIFVLWHDRFRFESGGFPAGAEHFAQRAGNSFGAGVFLDGNQDLPAFSRLRHDYLQLAETGKEEAAQLRFRGDDMIETACQQRPGDKQHANEQNQALQAPAFKVKTGLFMVDHHCFPVIN